jgi:hypothetical protein
MCLIQTFYTNLLLIFGVTKFGSGGCFRLNQLYSESEEKDFTVNYISKSYLPMK